MREILKEIYPGIIAAGLVLTGAGIYGLTLPSNVPLKIVIIAIGILVSIGGIISSK